MDVLFKISALKTLSFLLDPTDGTLKTDAVNTAAPATIPAPSKYLLVTSFECNVGCCMLRTPISGFDVESDNASIILRMLSPMAIPAEL